MDLFGDRERIRVANRAGPWQEVAIVGFKLAELDTPAFRKFLKEAVESFQSTIGKMRTSPEDVMPWKLNGERWHLGEKGFPPGYRVKWERAILPRLLEVVKESIPDVTVQWDNRLMLTLRLPGMSRAWAYVTTKSPDALDLKFSAKKGQFNLSRLDGLSGEHDVSGHRRDCDVVQIKFRTLTPVDVERLRTLLPELAESFRKASVGA
jgi:excinuclease ABC subunit A